MIAALLLLAQFDGTPDPKYSDKLILSMTRQKWFDYYTERESQSTMGMAGAEALYGGALGRRNDQRLKTCPVTLRRQIQTLRPLLEDYRFGLIEVGRSFTGGGTMWTPVGAATTANVEELVAVLIQPNPKTNGKRVTSDVTAALGKLKKGILASSFEDSIGPPGKKEALEGWGSANAAALKAFGVAKGMNRARSDRILNWLRDQVKVTEFGV